MVCLVILSMTFYPRNFFHIFCLWNYFHLRRFAITEYFSLFPATQTTKDLSTSKHFKNLSVQETKMPFNRFFRAKIFENTRPKWYSGQTEKFLSIRSPECYCIPKSMLYNFKQFNIFFSMKTSTNNESCVIKIRAYPVELLEKCK